MLLLYCSFFVISCSLTAAMNPDIVDASAMKMDDEIPPAKKARKEDDERVERAARMILKSPMLSVPQVSV